MILMLKCLHSHIYKIVKSPLFYITILWPIICVGLFISYYSVSSWSIEQNISGFFQALSLFMDCLVVMLCTGIVQQEQRAGSSFNILCVGKSRIQMLISLVILLVIMTGLSLIIAVAGFALLYGKMLTISYVLATILMLIPLICLVSIHLFIAFKFGTSWSIGFGVIFILVGALGCTGLLDKFWYYLPPTWAARFSSLMILDTFHTDYILKIAAELRYGLLICIIVTIALVTLIPIWFNKWDGRADNSDE